MEICSPGYFDFFGQKVVIVDGKVAKRAKNRDTSRNEICYRWVFTRWQERQNLLVFTIGRTVRATLSAPKNNLALEP